MKTFPITPAVVLALACLQVQQAPAAELTASLDLQNDFGEPDAIYRAWVTNTSSATSLYHADSVLNANSTISVSYGNLELALWDRDLDDSTPPGSFIYSGGAYPQASWSDTIIITNAALNGTWGHYRPRLSYTGTLHASARTDAYPTNAFSYTVASLTVIFNNQVFYDYNQLDVAPASANHRLEINLDADDLAAANGIPKLDIPFVFGQPFPISASLYMQGINSSSGIYFYASEQAGFAQLHWQGGRVFDADTNEVTDFQMISESGIDWALSQSFPVPVLQISGINISDGTNLVINGTGGLLAHPVTLLTSTNLTLPIADWDHLSTNYFDYSGGVSFTNLVNSAGEPERFFRLQSQ